jgi:hypothetical protein
MVQKGLPDRGGGQVREVEVQSLQKILRNCREVPHIVRLDSPVDRHRVGVMRAINTQQGVKQKGRLALPDERGKGYTHAPVEEPLLTPQDLVPDAGTAK